MYLLFRDEMKPIFVRKHYAKITRGSERIKERLFKPEPKKLICTCVQRAAWRESFRFEPFFYRHHILAQLKQLNPMKG